MALLDPNGEAEAYPVIVADVTDVPGLKPTITNTIEVGYKGAIGGAFVAGIDVYGERVTNFIGQFEVVTPNVFMNASDVITYLRNNGMSRGSTRSLYGSIIGTLPLGTVSPEGVADPTAVMVAPRNFGKVELWGADLSLEFSPSPPGRSSARSPSSRRTFSRNSTARPTSRSTRRRTAAPSPCATATPAGRSTPKGAPGGCRASG